MAKPARPVQPSKTDAARAILDLAFRKALGNDANYAHLVKPQAWLNIFLASEDLDRLRALGVSWKNGYIPRLLGEEHATKMKDAGVELAESPNGFIVFRRIK